MHFIHKHPAVGGVVQLLIGEYERTLVKAKYISTKTNSEGKHITENSSFELHDLF